MSERIASASAPICSRAAASVCASRPVMTTRAPSAAKASAAARPMPLLPPNTSTTLFSNRGLIALLPFQNIGIGLTGFAGTSISTSQCSTM